MTKPDALQAFVGGRLRCARREAGLTQRKVAEGLGVSHSHITQVERGLRAPSLEVLSRWARLCGVRLAVVFDGAEAHLSPPATGT